jgi:hypothetical protein
MSGKNGSTPTIMPPGLTVCGAARPSRRYDGGAGAWLVLA